MCLCVCVGRNVRVIRTEHQPLSVIVWTGTLSTRTRGSSQWKWLTLPPERPETHALVAALAFSAFAVYFNWTQRTYSVRRLLKAYAVLITQHILCHSFQGTVMWVVTGCIQSVACSPFLFFFWFWRICVVLGCVALCWLACFLKSSLSMYFQNVTLTVMIIIERGYIFRSGVHYHYCASFELRGRTKN